MKSIKRLALVCMMAVCFCTICSVEVSAIGLESKLSIFDGSTLIEENQAEDTTYVLARGSYLSYGESGVYDLGNRVAGVGGGTFCHTYCDKVICNLYLEQLDDEGHWYTYKYWQCYTTNAAAYMPSKSISVPGGHWYRVRGGHSAVKDGTTESVTTKTNGIYIS